jgi:DNA-binding GntR family transcriptional regulator
MPGLSRVALIGSLVDRSSQHFVLLDAIRRGDQQEVINSVTRHLEFSRASIPASLRKNLLDEIPNPDLLSPKVD